MTKPEQQRRNTKNWRNYLVAASSSAFCWTRSRSSDETVEQKLPATEGRSVAGLGRKGKVGEAFKTGLLVFGGGAIEDQAAKKVLGLWEATGDGATEEGLNAL